jgi:diguanylate cyclase (GGDEF)-like protein/PAS domain S-box-containing protein
MGLSFNAYDFLPTPVLITDLKGLVVYVNPAFTRLTGYESRDMIGKSPGVLSSGRTPARVYQDLWKTIRSGAIWHGELENRTKNGQVYLESILIAPVTNTRGTTTHFVASWQDITHKRAVEQKLKRSRLEFKKASHKDSLTGLYNRRGFYELMEHQILLSRRQKHAIALLYLDLDNFKRVNDRWGHKQGDQVLMDTAKLIRKVFRTSDIAARLGGDEFVIAAIDSEKKGLSIITRRLKTVFDRYNQSLGARPARIEYSLGSLLIEPDKPTNLEAIIEKVDRLMYQRKKINQTKRSSAEKEKNHV